MTWTEGLNERKWVNGRELRPSEMSTCVRCGYTRQTRPDRDTTLCRDCRNQQAADDKAWLLFHPRQPMSVEDLAWCIRNAAEHKERRPVIYYTERKEMAA
jgi:hypothetical protein